MIEIANNEIIVAAIFLVPGFLFLHIIYELSAYNKKKIYEHEYYFLSLFVSVLFFVIANIIKSILAFFKLITYSDAFVKPTAISLDYSTIIFMYLAAIILGSFIGKRRKNEKHGDGNKINNDSVWVVTLSNLAKKKGKYAYIITSSDEEFYGRVKRYSGDADDEKMILIDKPSMIIRDQKQECIDEIQIWEEILFTESDIKRISFNDKT
ncbi:hypothetical protein [Methanococcoides seepicolus]|uniref:Uncharacterized protein n=1 Tax=Methanococcoides seepicolus TaxID=2828780 RepID=A0A9E4ZD56_9EURY|nr:hypothetical protein [Methanococcoides seepicolus]MCM1986166.1 hypothetical protein [Methanococcoides seepicolus]